MGEPPGLSHDAFQDHSNPQPAVGTSLMRDNHRHLTMRCPGQDQRYWKADDIFDMKCPYCGNEIEFWKDEPFRICKECSREIRNPRINLGCAKWCKNADACLGRTIDGDGNVAAPVVEKLAAALEHVVTDDVRLQRARAACSRIDRMLDASITDPLTVKAVAFLAGAFMSAPPLSKERTDVLLRTVLDDAALDDDASRRIEEIIHDVLTKNPCHLESRLVLDALESEVE